MKICVFQSCFEELQASVGEAQELCMNPGPFTTQHTVAHKTIHKKTAKEQIDEAVSEGYDFYLNFMWGTHDDSLAGIDAIRYFESLKLPSAGVQSSEREQSKWDFFTAAKIEGSPPVPGTENFPLFVKPASSYGSMFIDEHSLCRNETELALCIERLNKLMRPVRIERAKSLDHPDPDKYAESLESAGRQSTDIVVQEFIDGEEFSVVVIAMGQSPFPLIPQKAKYKQVAGDGRFLTLDLKFDAESGYELINEADDPDLYRLLQNTAMEAFTTNKMYTNLMGCDVDMRIGRDGRAYVIEVDPLPVFFYPTGSQLEDTDVKYGFPGGYRAVINTYITNYFLKNGDIRKSHFENLATLIDNHAESFQHKATILPMLPLKGSVIDLGCGSGALGHALRTVPGNNLTRLIGVDISANMLGISRKSGQYDELVHQNMVQFLSLQTEKVDHIFCVSALSFLSMEELDFVLARCFQLSHHSITLAFDDWRNAPEMDIEIQGQLKEYYMNHLDAMKSFEYPRGWKLDLLEGLNRCHEPHQHSFHFTKDMTTLLDG
ncbi:hypothetical protein PENSTE_c009G05692 [Penicillium steckii]|uniref:ATP-grasp domain-containing protein n=1 Tax=Penicillium steckii TaxID=303698 RepID=A0A1V6TAB5_9EURO|nr:hypothetical protein PENSTE_c009G05692 [Penicillium steckii]